MSLSLAAVSPTHWQWHRDGTASATGSSGFKLSRRGVSEAEPEAQPEAQPEARASLRLSLRLSPRDAGYGTVPLAVGRLAVLT